MDLHLSHEALAALTSAMPSDAVTGERYPAAQVAHLDSEAGRTTA